MKVLHECQDEQGLNDVWAICVHLNMIWELPLVESEREEEGS